MDFSLHRSFADLDGLAQEWNDLLDESLTNVPFLRYEFQHTWWETRGGGEWPQAGLVLVLAREAGRLVGVAPLFSARNQAGRQALLLLGSVEIADYLDLIVRPADTPAFMEGLLDFLDHSGPAGLSVAAPEAVEKPWQVLELHNLPETSPTLSLLRDETKKRSWSYEEEHSYHAPSIPLPGDFETYLCGIDKKQRHEIRRKMRRTAESGSQVRWYIADNPDNLAAEVEAFLNLMATEPTKADFLTEAMRGQMQRLCRAAMENGWLQLAFLEIDGQKAAGYLNFDYRDSIWVYNSGIDTRFRDFSPGWVLLGHLLQWANENHKKEFDFMRGEEDYKYRFGAVDHRLLRVRVTR
jgi:CelD/BcsL family acetyltransferase involved in cellulose biosynthesis